MYMEDSMMNVDDVARLLTRMASADGVVSQNERKILKEFAGRFGLDQNYLYRLAHAQTNDVHIPDVETINPSEYKGRMFEEFVVSLCSDHSIFRLLSWRSDKIVGNTYAAENLMPDLLLRHKLENGNVEYYIECKYRSQWGEGVDLSNCYDRYHREAKKSRKELFIALGIGGTPSDPDEFLLIPDRMVRHDKIIDSTCFVKCHCDKTADAFHAYIQHYFDKRVFKTT